MLAGFQSVVVVVVVVREDGGAARAKVLLLLLVVQKNNDSNSRRALVVVRDHGTMTTLGIVLRCIMLVVNLVYAPSSPAAHQRSVTVSLGVRIESQTDAHDSINQLYWSTVGTRRICFCKSWSSMAGWMDSSTYTTSLFVP